MAATKKYPLYALDMTADECGAEVIEKYESLLRRATGRGGWQIKRITSDGKSVTVYYTDFVAEFGYAVSPDLNPEPRVREMKFTKK